MSKAMFMLLVVAAVLAVQANATQVQLCGTGVTDTTSVQLSNCDTPRCQLTRGASINLRITFTPTSIVESLTTDVTAEMQGSQQPLPDLNGQNACNNIVRVSDNAVVSCPLNAGVQYLYTSEGILSTSYPAVDSRLHWGLKQDDTTEFCFEVDIRLV